MSVAKQSRPHPHSPEDEPTREAPQLDLDALGAMIRDRRGELSIRQAAEDAGISFMTLSRVEKGSQPDLATFVRLCSWLRVPPETFFSVGPRREASTLEVVAQHLSHDPRLDRTSADKIVSILREMYNVLAHEPERRPAVACHLRAASVLRPGVPERLASLLTDMQERLESSADGDFA